MIIFDVKIIKNIILKSVIRQKSGSAGMDPEIEKISKNYTYCRRNLIKKIAI